MGTAGSVRVTLRVETSDFRRIGYADKGTLGPGKLADLTVFSKDLKNPA